ncbi:hypothetical protein KVV02_005674 [Mortierella alpina]|uniref:Uncharacterized protein n=1 Tax=Mortierella alpina TaxID=64518 RepID=A0A9P8D0R7_MORAP|nr:hypothetical protein KVV02_005674 [Mortierella alpina]
MPSNSPIATNMDMAHAATTPASSPGLPAHKTHQSPSPAPLQPEAASRSSSIDDERDRAPMSQAVPSLSDQPARQQLSASPSFTRHSPVSGAAAQPPYSDRPHPDERSYNPQPPTQEYGAQWQAPQERHAGFTDHRERHPPESSQYQHEPPYYNGPSAPWSRADSPSAAQAGPRHLSFTRHGSQHQQQGPRSPPPYPQRPRPTPSEIPTHKPYPGMPPSPVGPTGAPARSPEEYQNKRHHIESDSEGYSDPDRVNREREAYYGGSYYHYNGKAQEYSDDYRNQHHQHHHHPASSSVTSSMHGAPTHPEGLPALAPRPHRYSMEEDQGQDSPSQKHHHSHNHHQHYSHHQQPHQYQQHQAQQYTVSSATQIKKENEPTASAPFRIHSARGTPKGPLPIEVQISLLTSVLKHDPFNCPIRKTTQAWECISREQHIRARTCSRRFDNIIQASIAGRDRPVGTEDQQATKKRLLEQLFEMMNQPQALKRMQKKRRYRSEDTDRRLLLETIRLNPFAQKVGQVAKAWEDVRDALKMKVHARQCIRRVNRMVKPYQLRERMYKGHIPDEMKEANDDLVKQVIQLMRMAGQGGSLDDEDSASGISDSDDQEDPYMEPRCQENNTHEDDELEEDEDEDMMSRSESEQRNHARRRDGDASVTGNALTPRSPGAPVIPSPSTLSTTPSHSASISGPSSTPTTPGKRGRPRNVGHPSSEVTRHSSHGSVDRTKSHPQPVYNNLDGPHESSMARQRIWEGEGPEQNPTRLLGSGDPDDRAAATDSGYAAQGQGQGPTLQSTPLSSPLSVHSPTRSQLAPSAQGPGHARHYSRGGEPLESGDYKRPIKHARTNSRGVMHEGAPATRADAGLRMGGLTTMRNPAHDVNGRPAQSTHANEMALDPSSTTAPTAQQFRDVLITGGARYLLHTGDHHGSFHKNMGVPSPYPRSEGQSHYPPRDRELR